MSLPPYLILRRSCHYASVYYRRPLLIVYKVHGSHIKSERAIGWCHDCDSVVDMEKIDISNLRTQRSKQIERIADLKEELTALSSGLLSFVWRRKQTAEVRRILRGKEEGLNDINALITIAKSRSAKARCLKCFGENVEKVSFQEDHRIQFEQGCDKGLYWDYCGDAPRFHAPLLEIHLDANGNPIP